MRAASNDGSEHGRHREGSRRDKKGLSEELHLV